MSGYKAHKMYAFAIIMSDMIRCHSFLKLNYNLLNIGNLVGNAFIFAEVIAEIQQAEAR